MIDLERDCNLLILSEEQMITDFDCGNADLNEFFNKVKEYVPREKSLKSYPGILIGRLGVATEFNGQGAGSQLLDFIKDFCIANFPDFVRYLLVDAYNEPAIVGFYQKNKFISVFSTEEQEKKAYGQIPLETLRTRYMFYDMIQWRNKMT